MTFKLGLTGSIGMGKSTTADMFKAEGCAVWDADAAVHRIYAMGGAAVEPIRTIWPDAIDGNGVSRTALKDIISAEDEAFARIEAIVHPLVRQDREIFLRDVDQGICVFDIPLLFETGGDAEMDAVACVHVPADEQRRRVLERGTMTEAQLDLILRKQLPIEEKLARSDYCIETDTPDHAREQVKAIVAEIRQEIAAA